MTLNYNSQYTPGRRVSPSKTYSGLVGSIFFFFLIFGLDLQDSFCDPQVGYAYSSETLWKVNCPPFALLPPRSGQVEGQPHFPPGKPKRSPYTRPSEGQCGGHLSWSGVTRLPPCLQSVRLRGGA